MDSVEVSQPVVIEGEFDLGHFVGRREAYGLLSGNATAEDITIMRKIRDERLFKTHTKDWPEFCVKYLHLSKTHVNRMIGLLEEFGPQYFRISQLTRVSPATYRTIAPAVREDGIEFDGRLIPIQKEHSHRVAEAVARLSANGKPARSLSVRMFSLEASFGRLFDQFRELLQECGGVSRELMGLADRLQDEVTQLRTEMDVNAQRSQQ